MSRIAIVYHNFLCNDWKKLIKEQLSRLKKSGLYEKADLIYSTVILNGVSEDEYLSVIKSYKKIKPEFHSNNNYEFHGINKVKELGNNNDDLVIFYFHTKGVSNKYTRFNEKDNNYIKVNNINSWRECLEYFLIDKWKECVDKLNEFDTVGVTCNNGWYWGNFWWATSKHIQKCNDVLEGDRWYYEDWLNHKNYGQKNYEWYHFTYNPYVTYIDPDFYKNPEIFKGQKIVLHKALYGSPIFEIDEGYNGSNLDTFVDVTEKVNEILEKDNYNKIEITTNNDVFGVDPIFGTRKFFYIDFSFEKNLEKIYHIGTHEGTHLSINFND